MNRMMFRDQATQYTRISKVRARSLFKSGKPIYMIACKMRPGAPFHMGMLIYPNDCIDDLKDRYMHSHDFESRHPDIRKYPYYDYPESKIPDRAFDELIDDFKYYNCSYETGYYPAFYEFANA